jgi:manganese/zinc/iron transport system permease protein
MVLDFWVILSACLVGASCSLLGCFMILRRQAMLADAISHAVLPAIVLAYLLMGSLQSTLMLLAASLMGVIVSISIEYLQNKFRIQNDSAMGIVFTFLFAIGVILTTSAANMVDLDLDCVLYGDLALSILNTDLILGFAVPNISFNLFWVAIFNLVFVVLFFRLLFATTFDTAYATAIGISALSWHYFFVGVVSLTTVVSFEAVGAILVVVFFVGPTASAYLLSDDLRTMLWLSVLLSVLSSVLGYYGAKFFNNSITGMISTVMGLVFAVCYLISVGRRIWAKKIAIH